jgi:hypothetical protein
VAAEGPPVTAFWLPLGLAYVTVTLMTSGAGHLVRPAVFRAVVRRHGIVPVRLAAPVAAATVVAELSLGTTAAVLLIRGPGTGPAAALFVATTLMGLAFLVYVRRLLRVPAGDVGCGCSPLAGPLTPAARVPAVALAVLSALSLAAALAGDAAAAAAVAGDGAAAEPLGWLWGATLAVVVLLVPAVAPRPLTEGGH